MSGTSCYNNLKIVVLDSIFWFVCDTGKHNGMHQNKKRRFTLKIDFYVHVSGVFDYFMWPS